MQNPADGGSLEKWTSSEVFGLVPEGNAATGAPGHRHHAELNPRADAGRKVADAFADARDYQYHGIALQHLGFEPMSTGLSRPDMSQRADSTAGKELWGEDAAQFRPERWECPGQ